MDEDSSRGDLMVKLVVKVPRTDEREILKGVKGDRQIMLDYSHFLSINFTMIKINFSPAHNPYRRLLSMEKPLKMCPPIS